VEMHNLQFSYIFWLTHYSSFASSHGNWFWRCDCGDSFLRVAYLTWIFLSNLSF
jgi:hypothetical protein